MVVKKVKKRKASTTKAARMEAFVASVEQTWMSNDSRVIARQRDVHQFELATVEEHLAGLKAATESVLLKKNALEARIAGLTRVLARR